MSFTINVSNELVRALADHPRRRRGCFLFEPPDQVYSFEDPSYGFSYCRMPEPIASSFMVGKSLLARLKKSIGGRLEVHSCSLRSEVRTLHPEQRFDSIFAAHTCEHDPYNILRRHREIIERALERFGARVADDILPRELIERTNTALELLREPLRQSLAKSEPRPDQRLQLQLFEENDPGPHRHTSSRKKLVVSQARAALLICDGHIRLGLSAVDEAKHHLDRVTSLLVSPVVEPFGREGGFCCLVDPREHGSSTEWWLPLSERWAELKSCDHAVTVYEPRMIELRPLSGVVRHIWEADRHASDVPLPKVSCQVDCESRSITD